MYDDLIKRLREADISHPPVYLFREAADAIEELLGIAQRLKHERLVYDGSGGYVKKTRWISVEERLPEQEKQVLVTGIEAIGNVQIYGVKQLDGDVWRPTSAPSCYWEHWMPLPSAPAEE